MQTKIVSSDDEIKNNFINVYYSKLGVFIYKYTKASIKNDQPVEIGFASGGASMFDRDKLIALCLFDEKFSPFYAEDLDLSFRSKLWGWKTLFHPSAVSYHKHVASTINTNYSFAKRNIIHTRNIFYFYWKNLPYLKIFPLCIVTLPLYLIYKLLRGNPWYLLGFISSLFSYFSKATEPTTVFSNVLYAGGVQSESDKTLLESLRAHHNDATHHIFAVYNKKLETAMSGNPVCFNNISLLNPVPGFIKSIYLAKIVKPEIIHCCVSSLLHGLVWICVAKMLKIPIVLHFREDEINGWQAGFLSGLAKIKRSKNAQI